jgi:phage gpG-like protein
MIKGVVVGADELVKKLSAIGPVTQDRMGMFVARMAIKLQSMVVKDRLSGQVLHVRTGTLRRSIYQKVEKSGTSVVGIVGTNVKYAAAHEYGFDGTVTVKAHMRRLKSKARTELVGRKGESPNGEAFVRTHTRKLKLPERSFLRSALKELTPEIEAGFKNIVVSTAKGIL